MLMLSRNNDFRAPADHGPDADRRLFWAASTDQGESWSDLAALPVDTVVSRMQVAPQLVGLLPGQTVPRAWRHYAGAQREPECRLLCLRALKLRSWRHGAHAIESTPCRRPAVALVLSTQS